MKSLKLHRFILLSLIITLITFNISGCGTIKKIDINESDLMPRYVAMSIFEKHGYKNWAENPYLLNISSYCGTDKVFIEYSKIDYASYLTLFKSLEFRNHDRSRSLVCHVLHIRFNNVTEDQAIELTNAARSLGATKIDELKWVY